eukprot:scaffold60460_cov33-Tisochrysis_lutea.AAC.2
MVAPRSDDGLQPMGVQPVKQRLWVQVTHLCGQPSEEARSPEHHIGIGREKCFAERLEGECDCTPGAEVHESPRVCIHVLEPTDDRRVVSLHPVGEQLARVREREAGNLGEFSCQPRSRATLVLEGDCDELVECLTAVEVGHVRTI